MDVDICKGLWNFMLLSKSSVNSKGLDKEHEELLNVSTDKADVHRSAFAFSDMNHVLGGKIGASKELPAMDEDQERDSSENFTWTNLAGLGFSAVSEGAGKI